MKYYYSEILVGSAVTILSLSLCIVKYQSISVYWYPADKILGGEVHACLPSIDVVKLLLLVILFG